MGKKFFFLAEWEGNNATPNLSNNERIDPPHLTLLGESCKEEEEKHLSLVWLFAKQPMLLEGATLKQKHAKLVQRRG